MIDRIPAGVRAIGLAALLLAATSAANAQNHSELDWFTVETEHFIVHYHDGAEGTAREAARIAESIYPRITGFYDWEPPSKTHFVLADYEDYANGSAYFFDGMFEIWATNLEFDLRGTTQWLWNVITHEFVHLVNIQSSQRTPRNMPAVYLQWFDYENEKRTDVLTGYPNRLVSYPLSGVTVPAWFAEGSAQYMAPETHLDHWDAHRDMILRMAALDDRILPYPQMSLFKGSLESEQVYDHGFALSRYIAEQHGPDALREIIDAMRSRTRLSAEGAFEEATGKSGRELYDEWRAWQTARAEEQAAAVEGTRVEGRPLGTAGTYNVSPAFSPDGTKLAWLSSGSSPFHRTSLVIRSVDPADSTDAEVEALEGGVAGGFSWSPDGETIYFARREEKDRFGSLFFDLFAYDVEEEESTRLTRGARLRDPAVSPDGTKLVAVRNQDGTQDLVFIPLPAEEEAAEIEILTDSPFGRQLSRPRWVSNDQVVVSLFEAGGEVRQEETRELVIIDAREGGRIERLRATGADERYPEVGPDGAIYYASDARGAGFNKFDVFRVDPATGAVTQVTNVMGGAFYPAVSPDGTTLAYANYTSSGYQIYLLPLDDALGEAVADDVFLALDRDPATLDMAEVDWEPEPYTGQFSRFLWSPRVLVDEGDLKLGAYGNTRDVIGKQDIFGGVAVGLNGDFDAFAIYENRMFWPTFYAEAFYIRKNRDDRINSKLEGLDREWDLDLRYDALEFDVGVRLEKGSPFSPYYYSELDARFRYSKSHLNLAVSAIRPTTGLEGALLPKDGWDYYRGRDLILQWRHRAAERRLDAEISPRGESYRLRYMYSSNDLNTSGEAEVDDAGIIRTIYEDNTYHQVDGTFGVSRGLPFWEHVLAGELQGGWISKPVDDFLWFRVGSQPGLRGYSYYSLEGRAYALGRATYRFPLLQHIDRRFLQLHFEHLYAGVFAEAGLVWRNPIWDDVTEQAIGRDLIRDVGFEVRLDMVSFYTFPAKLYVEGAFPLDQIAIPDLDTDVRDLDATVSPVDDDAPDDIVRTDEEWRFYFGLLFGY